MLARLGLLIAVLTLGACAQEMLNPAMPTALPPLLRSGALDCYVETFAPQLDFFFRFESSYLLSCPVRQFEGKASTVETVLRVTPEGGTPVILGSLYKLPALPSELRATVRLDRVRSAAEVSEGFGIGEGTYQVELMAFDDRHREFRHHWKVRARRTHGEQTVQMTLKPGSVVALTDVPWTGEHRMPAHRRVTILLNASPLNPAGRKLRAWDRAFLLGSLSSVLRELPCNSVRLIAFNLDQQREIFHANHFNEASMGKLEASMQELELGVVSVDTLKQKDGWIELLHSIAHEESVREDASDAVIFLGPWSRLDADADRLSWNESSLQKLRFFNIVYYSPWERGREFTDGIQRLTSRQDGLSYKIHSPGELAQALQKLSFELQHSSQSTSGTR